MDLAIASAVGVGSFMFLTNPKIFSEYKIARKLFAYNHVTITITGPDNSVLESWDEWDPNTVRVYKYNSSRDHYIWVTEYNNTYKNMYLAPIFTIGAYIAGVCMFG